MNHLMTTEASMTFINSDLRDLDGLCQRSSSHRGLSCVLDQCLSKPRSFWKCFLLYFQRFLKHSVKFSWFVSDELGGSSSDLIKSISDNWEKSDFRSLLQYHSDRGGAIHWPIIKNYRKGHDGSRPYWARGLGLMFFVEIK